MAEELAREQHIKGQEEGWDASLSPAFAAMVEHALDCIRRGEPVTRPGDPIELFWPTPRLVDMAEETVPRRNQMVRRVMDYWARCLGKMRARMVELDKPLAERSYRTVLAAQRLSDAIETYATRWRVVSHARPIELVEADCQRAAAAYVEAHKALDPGLRAPGPITTLDPDYVTYMRLCKRWNIKPGTMLHDARL